MKEIITLWDDLHIASSHSKLCLMSTELKCRVSLQYVMMFQANNLMRHLKMHGLTLKIENHGLYVDLDDKEVDWKSVLQMIGRLLDRYYVEESTQRDILIFLDRKTSTSWKVLERCTSAQSPVKKKLTLAKILIPIGIGVATAIAAPVVIPAAVGALGFGAGGIAGGSIAASMMSASAIANGGGVVAGGLVATLQSIGAVGAISASTAVTAGVAAGGASGAVVAIASKLTEDDERKE